MKNKDIVLAFLLVLCTAEAFSQSMKDLENVSQTDSSFFYEQRVHRNQWIYAQEIVKSKPNVKVLTPLYQGVPLSSYRFDGKKWNIVADAKFNQKGLLQGKYKLDFWLQPDFRAYFGNKLKPVESKTGLMLNTHLLLTKGLALYTGLYVPLVNDFDQQPLNLRLAPTYLNYLKKLGSATFLSASSGLFLQDRYGINVEFLHIPLDKSWSYGLRSSYTGFYYLYPEEFKYTDFRDLSVLAHAAYRFRKNDVSLKLTAGQFLYKDKGAKLEMIRQFSRAELSLFGVYTGNGATIGINLAFKIPPNKSLQTEHLRVRTGQEFPWQYLYSRGFKIGENFRLNNDLERTLRQYHTMFWNNEITRTLSRP